MVGPGAQTAQIVGEALRRFQGVPKSPSLPAPLLELVEFAPGLVPLQGIDLGGRLLEAEIQVVSQQILPFHGDGVGSGTAEDVSLAPDPRPDENLQRPFVAGQEQISLLLADPQIRPGFPSGGGADDSAVLRRENLAEIGSLPR